MPGRLGEQSDRLVFRHSRGERLQSTVAGHHQLQHRPGRTTWNGQRRICTTRSRRTKGIGSWSIRDVRLTREAVPGNGADIDPTGRRW